MSAVVAEPPRAAHPPAEAVAPPPVVRVEHLNHFYGDGPARNQVLFDNQIEVPPGQLIVMTGPSGAGKTTLLTLIGALRSVHAGEIDVLGRNLARLSPKGLVEVRRDIGFIFQMHNLFDALSAYENVKMAMQLGHDSPQTMRQRGVEMLDRLGLGHRIDHKPRELSGGERQRVAIARALVNRPRLVLADEPTAALDRESTRKVVDLLKATTTTEQNAAVLMVTHDYRVVDCADRLVHMVDGRIASDVVLRDALRICEFLRAVDLFHALTPTQLTNVAEKMQKRHFAAGETVIQEGDPGEEFFLISDGEVDVTRADHEVARLGRGEFFGEVALISGEPRNATVLATEPLDTFVLGKSDFQSALATSAPFRDQLHRVYFSRH
jgi:putative ABC transport system ATP-binding protein